MNIKVLLLLIGLALGAVVGWFTKPPIATLQLGPVNVQIEGNSSAEGSLTSEQWYYIGMITALGGLFGLGLGVAVDRRRV